MLLFVHTTLFCTEIYFRYMNEFYQYRMLQQNQALMQEISTSALIILHLYD